MELKEQFAMVIDMTRCVGCRGCQVACKQWNERPAEETTFFGGPGYQNPADLSAKTWTLVKFTEVDDPQGFDWVFTKTQCRHCLEPACVQICPVQAATKTDTGAVVVDKDVCIGCMSCSTVCPFNTPRYDADAGNKMNKCWMCFDRLSAGEEPACVKACKTDAIVFGRRDDIISEAEDRLYKNPELYIPKIYGKSEVGGTSVMYISNIPFETLGFDTSLPTEPTKIARAEIAPTFKEFVAMAGTGPAVFVLGVGWVIRRRMEAEAISERNA